VLNLAVSPGQTTRFVRGVKLPHPNTALAQSAGTTNAKAKRTKQVLTIENLFAFLAVPA
jgi:hypothetical protein